MFGHAGRFFDSRAVAFHAHAGTELILITAGECSVEQGGTMLSGGAGTLFVVPHGASHNQINRGRVRTSYVSVIADRSLLDDTWRRVLVGVDSLVGVWIEQLCDLVMMPDRPPQELCDGLVQAIVYRLREQERSLDRPDHPALSRARQMMDHEIAAPHTLASLSREACVSRGYLVRLFRERYGFGPMHFLQQRRMALADRLLRDPYLTVKQVGQAVGYDDPNYFTRLYRKVRGHTPRGTPAEAGC